MIIIIIIMIIIIIIIIYIVDYLLLISAGSNIVGLNLYSLPSATIYHDLLGSMR